MILLRLLKERFEFKPLSCELLSIVRKMKSEIDSWEETLEILADKELMESIKKSKEGIKKGRVITFKSISELRKRYR